MEKYQGLVEEEKNIFGKCEWKTEKFELYCYNIRLSFEIIIAMGLLK